MSHSNSYLLGEAVKITKAYARGGGLIAPDSVLKLVFEELKKINEEIKE